MIRNSFLKDPRLFIKNKHFRKHIYQDTNKYKNFFVKKITNDFKENFYTPDLLRNRMLNELFSESVPVILKEDDLNAMYFSVENRSPFLDKELFEFSMTIPNEFLIQDGYSKHVLRKSMLGVVDDKILEDRRKIGFNASINEIIDFSDKKNYEAFLDNNIVFDIVKKQSIEKLLKKRFYSNSESKFLFNFINTKIFLEQ